MAEKTRRYETRVINALKEAGTYHEGLTPQLVALAGLMRTLALANAEIDKLTKTTVVEISRYGEKTVPHPAFKVQRDAADAIMRQLKQLGLTTEMLGGGNDSDPLVALTQQLIESGAGAGTLKPELDDAE
jgi:hypothetical protein